jgi:hypothetical protein
MPNNDVSMEKVSLDFGDDLGNDFGIQDTQVLAGKDLQSFLFSDPDKIKEVEEEEEIKPDPTKVLPTKQKEEVQEFVEKPKPTTKKEEKPDGEDTLKGLLYGEDQEEPKDPQLPEKNEEEDTYETLSKDLLRLGVFSKNSEDENEETLDIKTPEQLLERFNLEKKKGAINIIENFLGQYGEDYRKMFDAVFVNGVKPQDYLQSFAKIQAISEMNMEDESNQERVVRAYYRELKWDDQKIDNRIAKLKDYGDLEDEAKSYHEVMLNKEKEKADLSAAEKAKERQAEQEKELTTKKALQRILSEKLKSQDFDGIPVTQKDVEEGIAYMTDKKYKLPSGELLTQYDKDLLELNRPENHELKAKLGLLLRKKLDLTSVKKTTISKKSDALFTLSTKNAKQASQQKDMKSFF